MNVKAERALLTMVIGVLAGMAAYQIGNFARIYTYQWGMDAYTEHNYLAASRYLHVAAFLGTPQAMAVLGSMYATARGADRNMSKAIYWLERGVEKDSVDAQTMLGTLYVTGPGLPVDLKKGIPLLERAALSGDRQAAELLHRVRSQMQ